MEKTKKELELQGLKGYAFLLVFFSHCKILIDEKGINSFSWFGACGVAFFLYLGGYLLIYNHSKKDDCIDIITEYKKILLKIRNIWPLHILTFILSIPLVYKAGFVIDVKEIVKILTNTILLHGFVPRTSFYFSYNAVSWYLCVYFLCLLASPYIIRFWNKIKDYNKVYFVISALIIFEFIWYIVCSKFGISHWLLYIFPPIRVIDYMIGGGLFIIQNELKNKENNNDSIWKILFCISLILVSVILFFSIGSNDEIFSVAAWTIPVSVFIFSFMPLVHSSKICKSVFDNKLIVTLGNYGLELFLFHQIIIRYIDLFLKEVIELWLVRYLFALFLSVIISIGYNKIYKRIIRITKESKD